MVFAAIDPGTILGLVIGAIAIAAATPYIRKQRKKADIDFDSSALALSQLQLKTEHDARLSIENRFTAKLDEQERRCSAQLSEQDRRHSLEIGELRGQMAALTMPFAKELARMVAEELKGEAVV